MTQLVFRMNLPSARKRKLVPGKLLVFNENGTLIDTYNATSGCRGIQSKNDQPVKGLGPIPECRKVGITKYTVPTRGYYLANPGVRGNFYHITPDPIIITGRRRGEFGIHKDANFRTSPGSAGCIVMLPPEFARFERLMSKLRREQGLLRLPLFVEYNRATPPIKPTVITPPKQFTVVQPKPGQILKISEPVTFSGTAKDNVSTIIILLGPGGPFKIAHLKNVGSDWSFTQELVTKGKRTLRIRAFDAEGDHLEDFISNFELV